WWARKSAAPGPGPLPRRCGAPARPALCLARAEPVISSERTCSSPPHAAEAAGLHCLHLGLDARLPAVASTCVQCPLGHRQDRVLRVVAVACLRPADAVVVGTQL